MTMFLPFFLISFLSVQAAVKKNPNDDLSHYRSEVVELGARLTTLEKEIGSKNNLYLSSLEFIKQFEVDVKLYRERLKEIQSHVKEAQQNNKRIIHSYLTESEDESTEAWQKKIHLELLKQGHLKLKTKEQELASFEAKVVDFDQKLKVLKQNEEELAQVIQDLESRKKIAMEKYMARVQDKKKVETVVQKKQLKANLKKITKEFSQSPIIENKPDRFFSNPVSDFTTYVSSAKGVTFKYQSVQPVRAVAGGKVVFAGDLSNYGQVLLIDHGGDLRTVLLGKMNIKVRKNDTVRDGEVLAYTLNDSVDAQNLYFEVRKKNTAQNTILWLDLNGVSKI